MTFELERHGQGFGWRLRSGLGITVAISPQFPSKRDCLRSIDAVKASARSVVTPRSVLLFRTPAHFTLPTTPHSPLLLPHFT
jgi:uncharacterized protein YegP (UPF0339 family)